jgi:hypothetical protein
LFIIASSGRSGTLAVCNGLDKFSDHTVMHEPEPTLLEEAFRKHTGLPYDTPVLRQRMEFFRERARAKYGESFRAPNLLPEIARAAPGTKFLILVRPPAEYVVSAHAKFVFRKPDDRWDTFRLLPDIEPAEFGKMPLSDKIAWHWTAVNRYLLDFAESGAADVRVAVVADLQVQIRSLAEFLGAAIRDPEGLAAFLASRPNASMRSEPPGGYDPERILSICGGEWRRAEALAARFRPGD